MRLINLVNFRKENGSTVQIGESNDFVCQFSRPLVIKPDSKVCLIHAEINNEVAVQESTGLKQAGIDDALNSNYVYATTKPQTLCYINCPSLPINTYTGMSNGGKGKTNHIIGVARMNTTDSIISSNISVDLENTTDLVLTELHIQILDNDYDLFQFGTGTHRQMIMLGIKNGYQDSDGYY